MDDILLKSIIDRVNAQDNVIKEMKDVLKALAARSEEISLIKTDLGQLNSILKDIAFPVTEMRTLSARIEQLNNNLASPVKDIVQHHHHFPKIIWICIGLFLALTVVCSGWYFTAATSSEYKANDTKYRYLKLNSNKNLMQLLLITDSLYLADPGLRDSIIQKEKEKQQRFDMLHKANTMEQEAAELKKKASNQ